MLSGLRHHTFISCDYQHNQIHAYHSGYHIINKFFMPRNINDSGTVTTWEVKPGKAKVYGDPSLLFFLPAVCITPGQGSDQSSLAMINMPCRTYYHMFHSNVSSLFLLPQQFLQFCCDQFEIFCLYCPHIQHDRVINRSRNHRHGQMPHLVFQSRYTFILWTDSYCHTWYPLHRE